MIGILKSPLEQFSIINIIPIKLGNFIDISFTNTALFTFMTFMLLITFFNLSLMRLTIIPGKWETIILQCYSFILNVVYENTGKKGLKYFPFILVVFIFILSCNMLGLVPYSFTVTSHFIVTFSLSFSIFIGIVIIGFIHHRIHFFSFFMPPGAPVALAPLLVAIEFISFNFRALSLPIRLFANIMAGHTLLKIMSGFGWTMFFSGGIIAIAGIGPVLILFAFTGLEIAVAFLQAYVYTILVCIYLNDSINLH